MRVVLAGLAVFAVLLLAVGALGELDVFETRPPVLVGDALGLFLVALIVLAFLVFTSRGTDPHGFTSLEEQIRQLEEADLLVATEYEAVRAFAVEEFEDEGSHYFLELTDGRVLFPAASTSTTPIPWTTARAASRAPALPSATTATGATRSTSSAAARSSSPSSPRWPSPSTPPSEASFRATASS
jgi:hypothetical protein